MLEELRDGQCLKSISRMIRVSKRDELDGVFFLVSGVV